MLRRLSRQLNDEREGTKLERKTSKRERLSRFFRPRRQKPLDHDEVPESTNHDETLSLPDSQPLGSDTRDPKLSSSPIDVPRTVSDEESKGNPVATTILQEEDETNVSHIQLTQPVSPIPDPMASEDADEAERTHVSHGNNEEAECLDEASARALFSGAPEFSVKIIAGQTAPRVSYPWDSEVRHNDAIDFVLPEQPAFMAATLHRYSGNEDPALGHHVYQVDAVEVPSWLSAQGFEPGSIGFAHFVDLPQADNLVTNPQYDEASEEFIETVRNEELMQTNPERIGIRSVAMDSVYDRLIEFQDLYETFQQSPERVTILNNQSPGDLYAHLFSAFLTPPGYAGANLDPTGLQVQILAILRTLKLRGIWHDFSLVEWRIRLGQLLFSDPEPIVEQGNQSLWTERDILLLQISLSCELLLRLDAITAIRVGEIGNQTQISTQEIETFRSLTTKKVDWDLVLARRFLENILVIKGDDVGALTPVAESRGLFSLLGGTTPKELPRSDVILLPQHQTRQLSGLLHFAESIKWPTTDSIVKSLAEKLGAAAQDAERTQSNSPSGWSFNPTTPSVVSVYGTPLQTPRSANHQLDDYFGRIQKPAVRRNDSRSLRLPLSTTLLASGDGSKSAVVDIGGWLSRSFLTGMILPGEPISHFLISTLLENDRFAMSALGDSANLYGGFVYCGKTWWSKASIVGRVLACTNGAQESMGWIYLEQVPQGMLDGWQFTHSEQLPTISRLIVGRDVVAADSLVAPAGVISPKDLIMPKDSESLPATSARFLQWDLTPLNPDLIDADSTLDLPMENDLHTPSLTFKIGTVQSCMLTLAYEVQFITSWPCYTPASTSVASPHHVVKRSPTGTLSHTSSKRSANTMLSRSNSHGFEPLLSHPPEAAHMGPQRSYSTVEGGEDAGTVKTPVVAHPLHHSYTYKIASATDVVDSDFVLPFMKLPDSSHATLLRDEYEDLECTDDRKTVLVIDARRTSDHQVLARAWCAEKGFHALIGRVERTCLACCIREARGLGVNIVIRV